jgi:hypothetical protein
MINNYLPPISSGLLRPAVSVFLALFMVLSFYVSSRAGTTEEITHLLQFIEQSECTFIRNAKQYDSLKARQHIEQKYNYYKDQILTTEDFIKYSATKSSITGKPYKVICNDVSINSSDWLKAELEIIRMQ